MFDLEAQIKEWRAELARSGLNAREVVDELEGHLRERIDRLIASGRPEAEAFQTAIRQLGDGKTLKTEFSKLKRDRLRIFRGNPPGINVLAVWFVVTGLNFLVLDLRGFCLHIFRFAQRFLENYSFKDVGPILPGGFATFAFTTIMLGLWILTGTGLLRRWRICQVAAVYFATAQIYWRMYYDVLGHPLFLPSGLPLPANLTFRILGWFDVPKGMYDAFQYVVLAILIWGVCTLLGLWAGKLFRPAAAE